MEQRTTLHMMTETSPFMMGFVVITKENNAIVIDGGRAEDVPNLLSLVGNRPIKAWFLTHAHDDHIDAFCHVMETMPDKVKIERVYAAFPPYALVSKYENYEAKTRLRFCHIENAHPELITVPRLYDRITIDEVTVEILMTYTPFLTSNLLNDSSTVFRLSGEKRSVLFLGDIGPEGGDELMRLQSGRLHADFVQMAHHGHMCCGPEVYMEIMPTACLWCAPEWLYREENPYIRPRMYGTMTTRRWMEKIGVCEHYVSKDGNQAFEI